MSNVLNTLDQLQSVLMPGMVREHAGVVVASPQSTEDVAAITRYASENRLSVEIAGAGTKRSFGGAVTAGVLLDMTQLAGLREHVWQDLTATVAAGTRWSAMQEALAQQGQRVALDPLWPGTATVGGIVATNDSGALRSAYGSLRDLIIGMKVVLADGTLAKTGGKVVKNVAGYDLHKLMTGAYGTLGVITEVTFRLHPLAKAQASWTMVSNDIVALEGCRRRIVASSIAFEALQMRSSDDGFALDLEVVSLPELMEEARVKLEALVAPLALMRSDAGVWLARERSFQPDRTIVKITMLQDRMADQILEIRAAGGECVVQQCGIMMATMAAKAAQIQSLRERVERHGGSLMVLHWPASVGERVETWGSLGDSFALMREIKRQFDPSRVLNPGRFVGGL